MKNLKIKELTASVLESEIVQCGQYIVHCVDSNYLIKYPCRSVVMGSFKTIPALKKSLSFNIV